MARVYGFAPGPGRPDPLPAPQPNVMADVLRGAMGSAGIPWALYGVGAVFSIGAQLLGFSGLAFALGMYLPMELNSPLVLGAAVAWLLRRSSADEKKAAARHDEGTLVASGFIAGGALVGVLAALLRFLEDSTRRQLVPDLTQAPGLGGLVAAWGNWSGLVVFLLLGLGVYWYSRRSAP